MSKLKLTIIAITFIVLVAAASAADGFLATNGPGDTLAGVKGDRLSRGNAPLADSIGPTAASSPSVPALNSPSSDVQVMAASAPSTCTAAIGPQDGLDLAHWLRLSHDAYR
ncbi:MAG: hypothetical protein P4L98_15135 [Ancalomicrobiaceae bacterium]|nr:hypothetical protein [Ancalomicrobiaceae bacterium]